MIENLFFLATPLLLISGLPQTFRLIKRKNSADISILTYTLTFLAVFLLWMNSIRANETALIMANGTSLLTVSTNLFLIVRYRLKPSPHNPITS